MELSSSDEVEEAALILGADGTGWTDKVDSTLELSVERDVLCIAGEWFGIG